MLIAEPFLVNETKSRCVVPPLLFFFFRAEYGEKTVQKLNLRIDNVMNDLVLEKTKTQTVNEELDQTFELFSTH